MPDFLHKLTLTVFAALLPILCSATVTAPSGFARCVSQLQERASAEGISRDIVEGTLGQVRFVPKVIELDRRQPEFVQTFGAYFSRRVSDMRVDRGREALREHRQLLDRLTVNYGVPPQYLVAFWGLETNYGSYLGKMPILDSLATLACDERRSEYFSGELLAALRVLEVAGVEQPLLGSWAGAMGNTQFMPSAYLQYAVDGDGDGRIDLWRSIPDALTSAANFLQHLGWRSGLRWGREVVLPDNFDYSLAGRSNPRALREWGQLGVRNARGEPLPSANVDAALLVPAGHEGPAFLVYSNFDIIMRWNRSEFYALSVGHLADRINGAGRLHQSPPDQEKLSIASVKQLQQRLNEAGFDAGPADGILGPGTRQAIRAFQKTSGSIADGYPRPTLFEQLGINL